MSFCGYKQLVIALPTIRDDCIFPMEGPGLGVELQSTGFERADLAVRRTAA